MCSIIGDEHQFIGQCLPFKSLTLVYLSLIKDCLFSLNDEIKKKSFFFNCKWNTYKITSSCEFLEPHSIFHGLFPPFFWSCSWTFLFCLANSLVSLEAGGGGGNPGSPGGYEYEWRPPASGVREWRQAISTPLAYRYTHLFRILS